jgi:hypothetical protein
VRETRWTSSGQEAGSRSRKQKQKQEGGVLGGEDWRGTSEAWTAEREARVVARMDRKRMVVVFLRGEERERLRGLRERLREELREAAAVGGRR